jgi:hypothetical protein
MGKFTWIVLVLSVFVIVGAPPAAFADATYTYTGNPYTVCTGSYAVSGTNTCNGTYFISGSFTLNVALAPGASVSIPQFPSPSDPYQLIGFSYTDNGSVMLSNASPSITFGADVSTDAFGAIIIWDIFISEDLSGTPPCDVNGCTIQSDNRPDLPINSCEGAAPVSPACTFDTSGVFPDPATGGSTNAAGMWTESGPTPAPEPRSFALMLPGIGLLLLTRKRISRRFQLGI